MCDFRLENSHFFHVANSNENVNTSRHTTARLRTHEAVPRLGGDSVGSASAAAICSAWSRVEFDADRAATCPCAAPLQPKRSRLVQFSRCSPRGRDRAAAPFTLDTSRRGLLRRRTCALTPGTTHAKTDSVRSLWLQICRRLRPTHHSEHHRSTKANRFVHVLQANLPRINIFVRIFMKLVCCGSSLFAPGSCAAVHFALQTCTAGVCGKLLFSVHRVFE